MKTVEECVVMAMDGTEAELFPYLPYILQDLWEIGADPETVIHLIEKHANRYTELKVLDLGCGKGAVSVKLAAALGCQCHGIDAIPEFIGHARQKALEYGVQHLCTFETGDIRAKIHEWSGYDIIILGAIGPVFGNYFTTLTKLSPCINERGFIIIDDGYVEDNSNFIHPLIMKQSVIFDQVKSAGMQLIDEIIISKNEIIESDDLIFNLLEKRCLELIRRHPQKSELFKRYIKNQEIENEVLANRVICSTMVVQPVS